MSQRFVFYPKVWRAGITVGGIGHYPPPTRLAKRTGISCHLFFLTTGMAAAALAQGTRIVEDWRVAVPPVAAGMPVTAVGPDGTVFLASRDGAITAVDRAGLAVFSQQPSGFPAIDALASDANHALYLAARAPSTGESLALLTRSPMGYQAAVVGHLGINVLSMAAVGRNRLAVAGYGTRNCLPLHLLTTTGKPIRSFGEDGGVARDPALARGFLLWREQTASLLFVAQKLAEIQIYDGEGNPIAITRLGSLGPAAWTTDFDEIDEIYGAALLPHGGLLIQGITSRARVVLRFLDEDFHAVASEERNDLGRLAGSDPEGALYFVHRNYVIHCHARPIPRVPRGEPSSPCLNRSFSGGRKG